MAMVCALGRTSSPEALEQIEAHLRSPDDALRAVKLIEPKQVVPIHYDTFDVIKQDPQAWAIRVQQETSAKATVMKPGDSLEI